MRLLALLESTDHVCGRYRVRAFAPALEAAGWALTAEGVERGLLPRLRQIDRAGDFDCVLVQRKLLPGWQVDRLRRRARRLVFDFDDAILYRDSNDPRGPESPRRERRFGQIVRAADAIIAGNRFLADCAVDAGVARDRTIMIPTSIDTSRYPLRRKALWAQGIDLVWIGSSSTLAGLEGRRDLWERVGREVSGATLRVICDRFPDLGALPVVGIPWSEAGEADDLATADVGVSWIPDDLWSRGKCGLKVLQYQAAGLPVVANPVGVHDSMVEDGRNGFLAETPEEWVRSIRILRDDPELRASMGLAARSRVEERYSVTASEARFVAAVSGSDPAQSKRINVVKHGRGGAEARPPTPRVDQTAGR